MKPARPAGRAKLRSGMGNCRRGGNADSRVNALMPELERLAAYCQVTTMDTAGLRVQSGTSAFVRDREAALDLRNGFEGELANSQFGMCVVVMDGVRHRRWKPPSGEPASSADGDPGLQ